MHIQYQYKHIHTNTTKRQHLAVLFRGLRKHQLVVLLNTAKQLLWKMFRKSWNMFHVCINFPQICHLHIKNVQISFKYVISEQHIYSTKQKNSKMHQICPDYQNLEASFNPSWFHPIFVEFNMNRMFIYPIFTFIKKLKPCQILHRHPE